ncbi:CotH kinase family protein [Peribacillus asahii]|uniref:Spore coat protein n=1 Tax=Peribacillus asahii TaxID=228899 RepID=A0A3T0KZA4_9BACI|nr:CotH kinase family protein [Peribacillus asahii]AZV45603.1 spore coat protein [Peribacillus asahii]USK85155.1 CotH kinase family protein [Peribacillus asahii]
MQHNIPTMSIFLEPKHLEVLESDIWNEELLPSKLLVNNIPYEIGITYRGDHIRNFPQKSFRVDFGTYNERFTGREIHLNAEYSDPSFIRNKLSFDFFQDIGSVSPDCKHVFVELNGKPMGIYLQIESVDEWFLQKRQLPYGSIFYATEYHANFSLLTPEENPKPSLLSGYVRKLGKVEDDLDLEMLIYKINTISRNDFGKEITKYLDVEKYLLWLCGIVCTQNFDGFIHNYALYRNGGSGLFQIIPWDYDATWGRDWDGEIMECDDVPIEGYNTLTARLLDVKVFRDQYRLLLEEILETSFTPEALEPKITTLHRQIHPYITLDSYKKKSIDIFVNEPELILEFIAKRNKYLREHLKDLT